MSPEACVTRRDEEFVAMETRANIAEALAEVREREADRMTKRAEKAEAELAKVRAGIASIGEMNTSWQQEVERQRHRARIAEESADKVAKGYEEAKAEVARLRAALVEIRSGGCNTDFDKIARDAMEAK